MKSYQTILQPPKVALGVALALGVAQAPSYGDESFLLEEVIVTAQKRQQSAQDLGLAVAAVSGRALAEQGIDQADDLSKIIPNVSVQNFGGGGAPVVTVRGVGLQNFRINDTPTTAFYVDEVYQTSIASAEFTMFDLARVEMLKGPQGGLYGRNTVAGAIQVISETPEINEPANGYVALGYGQYDKTEFEGAASIPVSDNSAVRVAGRWVQSDDKDYHSVALDKDHGEEDRWAGRVSYRLAPNDNTDILVKLHGGEDNSEIQLARALPVFGAGGYCASVLAGQGSSSGCTTVLGTTAANLGLGARDSDRYDSANDLLSFLENAWWGASAIVTYDFADYTLTSVSAYDKVDYRRVVDFDGLPVEADHIDYNTDIESWSQEFRLAYEGSDSYSWIAGVNIAGDEQRENTLLMGGQGLLVAAFGADYAPQAFVQETESSSVYIHAEWSFQENWNLVSELRYTREEKTFDALIQSHHLASDTMITTVDYEDKAKFDDFSGKVALEWDASENMLVYTGLSRGFKSGGFFGGFATSNAQLAPFDSETIDALELGVKSEWLDGTLRVNGSVFTYDRKDVQMNAGEPGGGATVKTIRNIGSVDTYGAELDLTWLASEQLSFQLSLGYTDAEIADSDMVTATSLPGLDSAASMEGENLPNYSKVSANLLARYEMPISNALTSHVQLEYSYRGEQDLSLITYPEYEDALFQESSYGVASLRVGLSATDDLWSSQLFIENLTDEVYRTEVRDDGLYNVREMYGAPRTWGVKFTYNFQ